MHRYLKTMKQASGQGFGYQSLNLYPVSRLLSPVSGIRVQGRLSSKMELELRNSLAAPCNRTSAGGEGGENILF